MKLLKILIILALVLFPFGELLRCDVGNNIVVKPLDILVGVAAIWWVIWKVKSAKFKVQNHPFYLPLIIFVSVGLLSLFINLSWLRPEAFFVSLLYLIRWAAYAMLFPIVLSLDDRFKKKLIALLFFDGLIILAAGFLQYFFFNNLKSLYHLGWDDHMHRIFSVFFDPNFAGAFFVLFFLFICGILYREILGSARMTKIWIYSFILFLTLIAVFLTFSRGALLMLIVGSVTFLILINKKNLLLILFGVILLFVLIASPKFYDENMNLFRTNSSSARLDNYSAAWRIIQDKTLLGVGFNTYRYAKLHYGFREGWVDAPSHADAGVDSSFLFVLATTGVLGLIAYGVLLMAVLRRSFYLYKKHGNVLGAVVIASSVGLFVNALFINSLFFPAIMLWMWVLIGLMESK